MGKIHYGNAAAEVIPLHPSPPKPPKPRAKRAEQRGKRGRRAWPGVALSADKASGVYYLRYRVPGGAKLVRSSCRTTSRAVAEEQARLKSAQLRTENDRRMLQAAAGASAPPASSPIDDELAAYYREQANAENASSHTLSHIERTLGVFRRWLAEHPVYRDTQTVAEISVTLLADYYRYLHSVPRRDGKPHKVTWVNQHTKQLKTVLYRAIGEGRLPLTESAVRRVLKYVRTSTRPAQRKHGIETSRPLHVAELQAMLRGAIAYDRAKRGETLVSADIAVCLLYGLRRAELTQLRCRDVLTEDADGPTLVLTEAIAKGSHPRLVRSKPWTKLGAELVEAMTADHVGGEWLSQLSYEATYNAFRLMRRQGYVTADISPHDLRATAATYQYYIVGINPKLCRSRMGHTEHNEDSSYIAEVRGAQRKAGSLEHAMRIKPELREIIQLVREQPYRVRRQSRTTGRKKVNGSLLKPLTR